VFSALKKVNLDNWKILTPEISFKSHRLIGLKIQQIVFSLQGLHEVSNIIADI
jgi:hypothetical protein